MKHLRLFTKALLLLTLLFGVTAAAMAAFSGWILERNLTEQYENKGKAIADGLAGASVEILLFRDAATIQALIDQFLEEGRIQGVGYIFVVDKQGSIISHTFHPGIPEEIKLVAAERSQVRDRHQTRIRRLAVAMSADAEKEYIDIASPILASEVGWVHVGMERDLIRQSILTAIVQQTYLMGAIFIVSIVAAWFMVQRLAEPLLRLTSYARSVASGDAAVGEKGLAVIASGQDEVGQLAHAFQHMVGELSNRERGLRHAQEQLQTLNATLEQRVAERSAAAEQRAHELTQVNDRLQKEIAERKEAEADLVRERHLLDALMDTIPDSIYFKDTESRFIRINKALALRFGMPDAAHALGKTDFDFFSEKHARPAFEDEQRLMKTGEPLVGMEEREIWPDGREAWVLTTKMPLRDREGNIIGTFGVSRDITRRKEAQDALEESERRYRQLAEASLDAIVVADQHERILLFNPAAQRIFGYPAAEIVGQPLTQLMPPEIHKAHQEGFQRFIATRRAHVVGRTVELQGRRKDGTEFPLELSLSALDLGDEIQFLGAIRDLTERNRLRAMMVQTEKLASIGQLSAGIAHEINNPLAYIGNNLVVLDRDIRGLMDLLSIYDESRPRLAQVDPEAAQRAQALSEDIDLAYIRENFDRLLRRTRDGVERVTRIVHGMRNLAGTAPPELQETRLADLVEMNIEIIRGQLRRHNINVDVNCDDALPRVCCVATQISQVVLNVLVNAMQAIAAANRSDGRIRIGVRRVGTEVHIEVADNGNGIDPNIRTRLFDPFFTTKPVGEGTGLGLSIAHGIVSGHGGRIEVDSEVGAGTTFRIVLPLGRPSKNQPTE